MTTADAESHYYNLTELVCTSSACFQNTRYLANYVIESESIENQNNQQFVISQNQNCVLCLEMYSFIKLRFDDQARRQFGYIFSAKKI